MGMKTLLFTCGLVLLATVAWAECQSVTIDGEEMMLCDAEDTEQPVEWEEMETQLNPKRGPYPERQYTIDGFTTTEYNDGTRCVSNDINGIVVTNCN